MLSFSPYEMTPIRPARVAVINGGVGLNQCYAIVLTNCRQQTAGQTRLPSDTEQGGSRETKHQKLVPVSLLAGWFHLNSRDRQVRRQLC
jgi:hypothetical protein